MILAVLLESDLSELTEEARRVYERHCRKKSQIVIFLTDLRKNPVYVLVSSASVVSLKLTIITDTALR